MKRFYTAESVTEGHPDKTVCADDCLAAAIPLVFGLTPKQIIDHFKLQRPIYSQTAVFGHFGRKEFPWERTDKVEALRSALL